MTRGDQLSTSPRHHRVANRTFHHDAWPLWGMSPAFTYRSWNQLLTCAVCTANEVKPSARKASPVMSKWAPVSNPRAVPAASAAIAANAAPKTISRLLTMFPAAKHDPIASPRPQATATPWAESRAASHWAAVSRPRCFQHELALGSLRRSPHEEGSWVGTRLSGLQLPPSRSPRPFLSRAESPR